MAKLSQPNGLGEQLDHPRRLSHAQGFHEEMQTTGTTLQLDLLQERAIGRLQHVLP